MGFSFSFLISLIKQGVKIAGGGKLGHLPRDNGPKCRPPHSPAQGASWLKSCYPVYQLIIKTAVGFGGRPAACKVIDFELRAVRGRASSACF